MSRRSGRKSGSPTKTRRSPASDAGTIALASALGYLDLGFEGAWRADHPRLVAWLDVFSDATPSFEATRFRG
jgi:hypothetical protein